MNYHLICGQFHLDLHLYGIHKRIPPYNEHMVKSFRNCQKEYYNRNKEAISQRHKKYNKEHKEQRT